MREGLLRLPREGALLLGGGGALGGGETRALGEAGLVGKDIFFTLAGVELIISVAEAVKVVVVVVVAMEGFTGAGEVR